MVRLHLDDLASALVALLLGLLTVGVEAQPFEPIFAADVEHAESMADTYRFFVVGHAYGAHTRKPQIYGANPFPASSLLANLEVLGDHDLGFFVGDVVQECGPNSLAQFKRQIADRLDFPIFNAMGNHDNCPAYTDHHTGDFAFAIGSDVFVVLSAMSRGQIVFLAQRIEDGLAAPGPVRFFVFTHRPYWVTLAPELERAGRRANIGIKPDPGLAARLAPLLTAVERADGARLYWFAGDVGSSTSYPILFHQLGCCVQLMATALYENAMDNFLRVEVDPRDVRIEVRSLTGEDLAPLEHYDVDWLERFLAPR